jgi:hypothetical protein
MRLGGQGQAVLEPDILADRECVGPAQGGAGLHGLTTGGRWIRTSSTRAPVNHVILFCAARLLGRVGACPVSLGCYDLTRDEIWVT